MVVPVDDDGVNSELVLDRVVPFVAAEVSGTFAFQDATGQATTETVTVNADGTGSYFDDGLNDGDFEWAVNSAGQMVFSLFDVPGSTDVFSNNFYKLADSQGDILHEMFVYRLNGELDNDADDPLGPPQVVEELNLIRLR